MVWIPLICAGSTSKNMFMLAEKVSCLSQGLGFSGQLDFAGGLQRVPGNMASHRQELLTFYCCGLQCFKRSFCCTKLRRNTFSDAVILESFRYFRSDHFT